MALSTKATPGKSIQKVLQPGARSFKINSVGLEKFPFKDNAYHILLNVEGPDLGSDFEGFFVEKNDPTKGKYKGQIGRIKASEWAFADSVTKGGTEISRDIEIMNFLRNLCKQLGITSWIEAEDNKHETIESLIAKFNTDAPFRDKWLRGCVGGKEYTNAGGYLNYDLYLPKFTMKSTPVELETVPESESKLIQYDAATYIKKKKADTVESFGEKKAEDKASSGEFDL